MHRVAIIGCGRPWRTTGSTGCGQAHHHARGYAASGRTVLAALADLEPTNAAAFREQHGGEAVFTDYRRMLAEAKPDIVSICTWPKLHAEMVLACAAAGVKAVHCEKPMAPTLGEARHMAAACADAKVQLTFNHQRRFGAPFVRARELLESGAIGALQRIEGRCSNLFDWGTHWFDMAGFMRRDRDHAEWVLAQVEPRGWRTVFAAPVEQQAVCWWRYADGVDALLTTGQGITGDARFRLVGSEGWIEAGDHHLTGRLADGAAGAIPFPADDNDNVRAVADLLDALESGREPELSARRALTASELIFAAWESARITGRVAIPFHGDGSPLQELIQRMQAPKG